MAEHIDAICSAIYWIERNGSDKTNHRYFASVDQEMIDSINSEHYENTINLFI